MSKKHRSTPSPLAAHSARHDRRRSHKRDLTLLWIGIGVVAIVVAALLLLRPSGPAVAEITPALAYEKYQAGALVVDVRTQDEWNQGHIAKSVLIPLDQLPNRLDELPKDREILVVCHTGVRAQDGAKILLNAGFTQVSSLSGGLQAWVEAGYPVQQ